MCELPSLPPPQEPWKTSQAEALGHRARWRLWGARPTQDTGQLERSPPSQRDSRQIPLENLQRTLPGLGHVSAHSAPPLPLPTCRLEASL